MVQAFFVSREIYNRTARKGEAGQNPDTHRSASMLQTKVQGRAQKVRKDDFTRDSVKRQDRCSAATSPTREAARMPHARPRPSYCSPS